MYLHFGGCARSFFPFVNTLNFDLILIKSVDKYRNLSLDVMRIWYELDMM
jgi:hypothetical protein